MPMFRLVVGLATLHTLFAVVIANPEANCIARAPTRGELSLIQSRATLAVSDGGRYRVHGTASTESTTFTLLDSKTGKEGRSTTAMLRGDAPLNLRFDAHGRHFDMHFEPSPSMFSSNATIRVARETGVDAASAPNERVFYTRDHDAVLTAVGSTLHGLVRHGDAFFDIQSIDGSSLLSVSAGKTGEATDFGFSGPVQGLAQISTKTGKHERPGNPDRWTNCYENDEITRALSMGVAMGSKLYSKFADEKEALQWLQSVFAHANLVYRPQLNFVLQIGSVHLQTTAGGSDVPAWNQGASCPLSLDDQLNRFKAWSQPVEEGLWHLFDDCYPEDRASAIGLAYVGVLCRSEKNWRDEYMNTGVTWYSQRTWKTFAHEIGHNFGGGHSFENGQGITGGIMDYGDGTLDDIFQFNTQFRKEEMCTVMNQAVIDNCAAITEYASRCGNGVLEEGEECECSEGVDCTFCSDCKLDDGKACSPDSYDGECCSASGEFLPSSSFCQIPGGGRGFCMIGVCRFTPCFGYDFVGDFCGLHPDNDCKAMCEEDGTCSRIDRWTVGGVPANFLPDNTPCNGGDGHCRSGECIASGPTPEPTPSPPSPSATTDAPATAGCQDGDLPRSWSCWGAPCTCKRVSDGNLCDRRDDVGTQIRETCLVSCDTCDMPTPRPTQSTPSPTEATPAPTAPTPLPTASTPSPTSQASESTCEDGSLPENWRCGDTSCTCDRLQTLCRQAHWASPTVRSTCVATCDLCDEVLLEIAEPAEASVLNEGSQESIFITAL